MLSIKTSFKDKIVHLKLAKKMAFFNCRKYIACNILSRRLGGVHDVSDTACYNNYGKKIFLKTQTDQKFSLKVNVPNKT